MENLADPDQMTGSAGYKRVDMDSEATYHCIHCSLKEGFHILKKTSKKHAHCAVVRSKKATTGLDKQNFSA